VGKENAKEILSGGDRYCGVRGRRETVPETENKERGLGQRVLKRVRNEFHWRCEKAGRKGRGGKGDPCKVAEQRQHSKRSLKHHERTNHAVCDWGKVSQAKRTNTDSGRRDNRPSLKARGPGRSGSS